MRQPAEETQNIIETLEKNGMLEALQKEAFQKLNSDVRFCSFDILINAPLTVVTFSHFNFMYTSPILQPEFDQYIASLIENSNALKQNTKKPQLFTALKEELEPRILQEAHSRLFTLLSARDKGLLSKIENTILSTLHEDSFQCK